jgi:alkyldihydroxyacetonephosphate synthase
MTEPTMPSALPGKKAPSARFDQIGGELDSGFLERLGSTGVDLSRGIDDRAAHGRDWWPLGVGWALDDVVGAIPGVVARPRSTEEVASVLAACSSAGVPVTPSAGRSGVCGGAIPLHGGVSLDLTGLDRVLAVDEMSLTVRVEAGAFGPELEDSLRATGSGYTLGHWPQSFAISTVGGWLACRGAGQYSTRYGKIEDMVRGLRVVLADGRELATGGVGPRSAIGPDLTQLFVGAEGTLGVITEATLLIHPIPPAEGRAAWAFARFADGLEACRRMLRRGATPAVLRLYDDIESERHFGLASNVMIVLDEADQALVDATMGIVGEEAGGGEPLESALVGRWLEHRNDVSLLAPLWEAGVVVDTIEMAGPWSMLQAACDAVLDALRGLEETLLASVHQSHAYPDGACLYFTFAGQPAASIDAQEAYYRRAWDVATAAILAAGCALSHHHGIGLNRARYMEEALGSSLGLLMGLKTALDPRGILNPGKLGLGPGAAW